MMRKWFDARDTFIGMNHHDHEPRRGLLLMQECCNEVEEARWICSLFADGSESWEAVLRLRGGDRGVVYMILGLYGRTGITHEDSVCLRRAADNGHHLSQAYLSAYSRYDQTLEERRKWSYLAAQGKEPWGLYQVAHNYAETNGETIALYKEASDLGHYDATFQYANMLPRTSIERYTRLLSFPQCDVDWCDEIKEALFMFHKGEIQSKVIYHIGRLIGQQYETDPYGRMVSYMFVRKDYIQNPFGQMMDLYTKWKKEAQQEVEMWSLVALHSLRPSICKDIRIMIAKKVWDKRGENKDYIVQ